MTDQIQVARVVGGEDLPLPHKSHPEDAGFDLRAAHADVLAPGVGCVMGTGFSWRIPHGWYGKIEGRSGMAAAGVIPVGGVIDSGYQGEVQVILLNLGEDVHVVHRGDRIAQMVVLPIHQATEVALAEGNGATSSRGEGSFGSTGAN